MEHVFNTSDSTDNCVGQRGAVVRVKEPGIRDQLSVGSHRRLLVDDPAQAVIGIDQLPSVRLGLGRQQMIRVRIGLAVGREGVVLVAVLPRGLVWKRHIDQIAITVILIIDDPAIIRDNLSDPPIKIVFKRQ